MKKILVASIICLSTSFAVYADTTTATGKPAVNTNNQSNTIYDETKSGWNKMLDQVAPEDKNITDDKVVEKKSPEKKSTSSSGKNQQHNNTIYDSIKSGWNNMLNAIAPPNKSAN